MPDCRIHILKGHLEPRKSISPISPIGPISPISPIGPKIRLYRQGPQLNPEERLNADLKREMGKRVPVKTKAKLHEAANEHMTMLEEKP